MRGICSFLLAFSLTVAAGLAFAVDYTVTAEHGNWYSRNVTPASAVRSNTTFAARAMVPSGPVVYTARELVYSPSTFGKLVKFAASPAGLVTITAAELFFEWWQQQPGNEITPDGVMSREGVSGACTSFFISCDGPDPAGKTSIAACVATDVAQFGGSWGPIGAVYISSLGATSGQFCIEIPSRGYPHCENFSRGGCPSTPSLPLPDWLPGQSMPPEWVDVFGPNDSTGPSPVSDEQAAQDLADSPYGSNEDVLRDFASDQNGRPWNTAEIDAMRRAIRDELASQDGTDPATLPDVPPGSSADPNNPLSPESQPDGYSSVPPGGGGANTKTEVTKLPDFCGWASVVCDWLGWTQEPLESLSDAPDLPVVEGGSGTWDSGLGEGACPAPTIISALGASIPISWQPACDFVSMLRPILIAFAGIAAALILLGQRAGGAG